jgi:hypothetical protein
MHHFIYPSKDTYITNKDGFSDRNFGLDEQLQIGTSNEILRKISYTTSVTLNTHYFTGYTIYNFTGLFVGSFNGIADNVKGTISGSDFIFTVDYFSGSATASLNGNYNGNVVNSSSFTGSVDGFGGTISGSATGLISGSLVTSCNFKEFNGEMSGSSGIITGYLTGIDIRSIPHFTTTVSKVVDRALLKFDINAISKSISDGTIVNPNFTLNVRVSKEQFLPINYSIYAFPVNQNWEMGNGFFSDNGSEEGVSWDFRDVKSGSLWYAPLTKSVRPVVDFINNPNFATGSFAYGGGTWYYTSSLGVNMRMSQSFSYEASDIKMNVTPIVNAWISRSISNEGFILLSSDEISESGSGFLLNFYSRDTNSIYSPYLDVSWDDSKFITGSLFTSSVQLNPASGSIDVCFTEGNIIGSSISGSISGSFTSSFYNGTNITGSVIAVFTSGSLIGFPVFGTLSGSWDGISLSGSFIDGNVSGSYFTGSSNGTSSLGIITGSFIVSGSCITGSTSGSTFSALVTGSLLFGNIQGLYSNGRVCGLFTTGAPRGAFIDGLVTGTYTTSSVSFVDIIGSSSLSPLQTGRPFTVIVEDVHKTYKDGDFVRIGVFGRKQFPLKTFGKSTQQEQYLVPEYLPTSSFYAIKDNESEEIILDFDNYTRISCDPIGNYFILDTTSFAQERYYRILIRVEQSGSVHTFDSDNVFKIAR